MNRRPIFCGREMHASENVKFVVNERVPQPEFSNQSKGSANTDIQRPANPTSPVDVFYPNYLFSIILSEEIPNPPPV